MYLARCKKNPEKLVLRPSTSLNDTDLLFTQTTKVPFSEDDNITTEDLIKVRNYHDKYMQVSKKNSKNKGRVLKNIWDTSAGMDDDYQNNEELFIGNKDEEENYELIFSEKSDSGSILFEIKKASPAVYFNKITLQKIYLTY